MSSPFDPPLFSILQAYTLGLCFSVNVTDQVSHPHNTAGKSIVMYVLIFALLDNIREDKVYEKN
jgi:hypothetical protein